MKDFDPNDETEAHHLLEALWLHQQHGVQNDELLTKLLSSDVKHAVVAAKTVKHFWHHFDAKGASEFAAPPESEFVKFNAPKHLSRGDQKVYKLRCAGLSARITLRDLPFDTRQGSPNVYPPLVDSLG